MIEDGNSQEMLKITRENDEIIIGKGIYRSREESIGMGTRMNLELRRGDTIFCPRIGRTEEHRRVQEDGGSTGGGGGRRKEGRRENRRRRCNQR